jgi:anti-sigma B factor antagonist
MGQETDATTSSIESGLKVIVFVERGVTHVAIDEVAITRQEEIDDFAKKMSEAIDRIAKPNLVVSFQNVKLICSRLLGVIAALQKKVRAKGGKIKLACVDENIRKVFNITQLDREIHIYNDVPAAVRSFKRERMWQLLGGPSMDD